MSVQGMERSIENQSSLSANMVGSWTGLHWHLKRLKTSHIDNAMELSTPFWHFDFPINRCNRSMGCLCEGR